MARIGVSVTLLGMVLPLDERDGFGIFVAIGASVSRVAWIAVGCDPAVVFGVAALGRVNRSVGVENLEYRSLVL